MSKNLILIRILLFFFIIPNAYAHAQKNYDLTKEDIYLGQIKQDNLIARATVELTRSKKTPVKVNIFFKYKRELEDCSEWREKTVIEPAHMEVRCKVVEGREECAEVLIPEKITTKRYCESYYTRVKTVFKKIVLDFRFAARLRHGENERFSVSFEQQRFDSGKFDITGHVTQSDHVYGIYAKSFPHKYQTLYFARR